MGNSFCSKKHDDTAQYDLMQPTEWQQSPTPRTPSTATTETAWGKNWLGRAESVMSPEKETRDALLLLAGDIVARHPTMDIGSALKLAREQAAMLIGGGDINGGGDGGGGSDPGGGGDGGGGKEGRRVTAAPRPRGVDWAACTRVDTAAAAAAMHDDSDEVAAPGSGSASGSAAENDAEADTSRTTTSSAVEAEAPSSSSSSDRLKRAFVSASAPDDDAGGKDEAVRWNAQWVPSRKDDYMASRTSEEIRSVERLRTAVLDAHDGELRADLPVKILRKTAVD